MKFVYIGLGIAIIAAIVCLVLIKPGATPITDNTSGIAYFSFSHNGMSSYDCYDYTVKSSEGQIKLDAQIYIGAEALSGAVEAELVEQLDTLVRKYSAVGWNGFHKTDKYALDGEGFNLSVRFNDGGAIEASGSNAFPDGYRQFTEELMNILNEATDKYFGVKRDY